MRAMHTRSAQSSLGNAKSPQSGEAETQSRTSDALISAAQGGDRAALDQLLAAARPRMVALALRVLGDVDEAEDAVQDAMVKVWRNVGRFEGRAGAQYLVASDRGQRGARPYPSARRDLDARPAGRGRGAGRPRGERSSRRRRSRATRGPR